jgi:HEAT repeat protein
MQLQQDLTLWRDLAGLALERVNALLVVGDFPAAALLAEAMRSQAEGHADEDIRSEAADTLRNFLTPSTMRHVAFHLDTANLEMVGAAKRFCAALGTLAIRPLAEVLSTEERNRPRQHLVDILIGFGAAGRQSVEHLRKSPRAAVRRTAVLLLREFGGQEALPELAELLDDTEPHVQREATKAVAMLGTEPACDVLIRALERGTEQARASILGVLASLPEDEREQVLSRLILKTPYRGTLWAFHGQAIERLGAAGGRLAVDALSEVLQRRSLWSPFKMAYLHRRAIDALARIGTPDAVAAIESAAAYGSLAGRAAARACLETRRSREKRQEPPE